ncbi:MAG: PAS domain S-box protein, partial [Deltaproteobacteria bacterium]|nr:PAS domain S-box protein [Deltaproteobacteria bacterium]
MARKPTYGELEQRVKALEKEVVQHKLAEEKLKKHCDRLEEMVAGRTAELTKANERLKQEVAERKRTEEELRDTIKRVEIAYEQSTIYAQQLNEVIDDRKRAAKQIRELSSVVEQSIDGIAISDLEPKLTYVNDAFARMHGYSSEEMIGMKVVNLHNEEQMEEYRLCLHQIETQGSWAGEIGHIRKDGTPFPTYMSVTLLKGDDGKPVGIAAVARDITKQKQAEEEKRKLEAQFQQAQKIEAIGTLASGIAHDFNNLLMGIQGNLSLMLMDIDSAHPYYERLKNIEKQVQTGARLTSHLLGYARKGRYEVKPIDLNQLAEETSDAFGRTRKEITIHRELPEDLYAIEADPGQIEQVLLNLFINASDAMPGGGDLILRARNVTHKDMKSKLYDPKPGNYVLLTVTDTGTGMDKETIERIFDPFFTTKEMGRGTGLGLASVYGIIKGHGGYIDVESNKGQGTTFSIYLPASEKKIQKAIKTAEPFIRGTGTVLLVDDEE